MKNAIILLLIFSHIAISYATDEFDYWNPTIGDRIDVTQCEVITGRYERQEVCAQIPSVTYEADPLTVLSNTIDIFNGVSRLEYSVSWFRLRYSHVTSCFIAFEGLFKTVKVITDGVHPGFNYRVCWTLNDNGNIYTSSSSVSACEYGVVSHQLELPVKMINSGVVVSNEVQVVDVWFEATSNKPPWDGVSKPWWTWDSDLYELMYNPDFDSEFAPAVIIIGGHVIGRIALSRIAVLSSAHVLRSAGQIAASDMLIGHLTGAAVSVRILQEVIAQRRNSLRTVLVYEKKNAANNRIYTGRTSGWGTKETVFLKRMRGHEKDRHGYTLNTVNAFTTTAGYNHPAWASMRGREQQLIDYHINAGNVYLFPGTNRPQINGVWYSNPAARVFHLSSNLNFLGEIHPYTRDPSFPGVPLLVSPLKIRAWGRVPPLN